MDNKVKKHIALFSDSGFNGVLIDTDYVVPASWQDYERLSTLGFYPTRILFSYLDSLSNGQFGYAVVGLEKAYEAFLDYTKEAYPLEGLIAKRKGKESFLYSLPLSESNKEALTQIGSELQDFLLSLGFRGDFKYDSTQRYAKMTVFVESSNRSPIIRRV